MIKKTCITVFGFLLMACVNRNNNDIALNPELDIEIRNSVKNATLIAKDLRGRSENEGGDENMVYEPSTYFGVPKAVWMRRPEVAYLCLIAIIASDRDFNQSNWNSFFHGIDPTEKAGVVDLVTLVSKQKYEKICGIYASKPHLDYESYQKKLSTFEGS
jgi:hypothetical protein